VFTVHRHEDRLSKRGRSEASERLGDIFEVGSAEEGRFSQHQKSRYGSAGEHAPATAVWDMAGEKYHMCFRYCAQGWLPVIPLGSQRERCLDEVDRVSAAIEELPGPGSETNTDTFQHVW
jgi:hypothetical protein